MAMGNEEKLKIIIEAQNKAQAAFDQANKQIADTEKKFGGAMAKMDAASKKMKSVGSNMSKYMTLPILAGAGLSIKAFSDLQETLNKVEVSFGANAGAVKQWSKDSIKNMGLAQQSALDAASLFGDMGTGMGQTTEEAAKMSMSLTQLGADMSSFKNVSIDRAQTALAGIYTGETEALKSLGVVMTETNLAEFAASKGIKKKISDMGQAEKVQLRYNFVMEKTKNAQGDFANTSDSLANKQRTATEKAKQLSAELGGKLAPVYAKLLEVGTKVLDWFAKLSGSQQKWIVYIGIALAVLGPLVSMIGSLIPVIAAASLSVSLIVAGIALLAAGLVYAYFKFEGFRKVVDSVWRAVVKVVLWAWNSVLKPIWNALVSAVVDYIIPAWKEFSKVAKVVWDNVAKGVKWAWENVIKPVWEAISWYVTNVTIPVFKKIWAVVQPIWNAIATYIGWAWNTVIKPIWNALVFYVQNVIIPIFNTVWTVIKTVWGAIWSVIQVAWAIVKPIFEAIWGYITNTLVPVFQAIWSKVSDVFKKVWGAITTWVTNVKAGFDKVKGWITSLIEKFAGIKEKIASAFSTVGNAIKAPFKTAFNWIANAWNKTLGKLSFTIPSWVPKIGGKKFDMPNMPTLYTGARNFRGGPAIVGDIAGRGGEIVNLPGGTDVFSNRESKQIMRSLADGKGGGGGGTMVTNTFTGNIFLADANAVEKFFKELNRQAEMAAMGVAS